MTRRCVQFVTLFEATVPAVDRAARCYVEESAGPDPFWDTLYGPHEPGGGRGLLHVDRDWDCMDF